MDINYRSIMILRLFSTLYTVFGNVKKYQSAILENEKSVADFISYGQCQPPLEIFYSRFRNFFSFKIRI